MWDELSIYKTEIGPSWHGPSFASWAKLAWAELAWAELVLGRVVQHPFWPGVSHAKGQN